VGWLAFAGYRIGEATAFGPAVWEDSEAYHAAAAHGWLSTGLWTGTRAPGTPVLFKLIGGSYAHYAIAQAVVGALAWGFLAWTASRFAAPGWRGLAASWAVLAFATAPLVAQWDWSALSESPSLSALAVLCALGLWTVQRFTRVRLAALALAALAYVALRDAEIWGVALVGVVLVVAGAGRILTGAAVAKRGVVDTVRRNYGAARPALAVGAALVAVGSLAALAANASHRNVENIEDVFYVRVFPFPGRVAWFAAHGMPDAKAIDAEAAATSAPAGMAKLVVPDVALPAWRPLGRWLAHRAQTTYALYLVTNPAYVLSAPFDAPPLTFDNADGMLAFYEPPGRALPVFETVLAPGKVVVALEAVLAVVVALTRGLDRDRVWRFTVAFAVVGLLTMLVAWHGDGQEVTRHMVEGSVEVRLGVLLALLVALLVPGSWWRGASRPTDPHTGADRDPDPLFVTMGG